MSFAIESVNYIFIFVTLYFEVFLFLSFLEDKNRNKGLISKESSDTKSVTILIPCFNEESTIEDTIKSIFNLDYPKEYIKIIAIDDGSKDNTLKKLYEVQKLHPDIQIITKENGGKHTALNLGLKYTTTPYVGCLDADSFVAKNALSKIMAKFRDEEVMAVVPSTIVHNPKTLIQKMQKAEYHYGNFIRYALSKMGAVHIAPGPFSFFKVEVFEKIGEYKKAHNTEDMEIAMRMQKNKMKIVHSNEALVYTKSPDTIKKLYKQRVRWVSGFFGNLIDYKKMILNPNYGDLGMVVLPMALFGIFMTIIFIGVNIFNYVEKIIINIQTIYFRGFNEFGFPKIDLFHINTGSVALLSFLLLLFVIFLLSFSRKITEGKWKFNFDFVFLAMYALLAPFWLLKAIYNNAFSKETIWR